MNKYVIELRPDCKVVQQICESDGQVSIGAKSIKYFEELNSDYINEHFGDLQDTAYQKGYDAGIIASSFVDKSDEAYQKGLDDAWEAAKKVVLNPDEGGLSILELNEKFNCTTIQQVFRKYTISEAIAKLKAYEEKQKADDKIEVGDEVKRKTAPKNERGGIVTKEWKDIYYIMWTDGSSGQWDKDRVVKTGRHFDIASILEEMRHD